jgi:integrase
MRIGWIDTPDIEQWVAALVRDGLSPSRIRQAHGVLSQTLQAAARSKLVPSNPAREVENLPSIQKREQLYLSSDETQRLAEAIDGRYRALVYVLGYCGLRIGEAIAVRRSSINLMRNEIRVTESATDVNGTLIFGATKTKQARTVAVPKAVIRELETHLDAHTGPEPDALVFTSPHGEPIRLQNFRRRAWKSVLDAAELPQRLRIHDMRHTAASLLINEGVSFKAVQEHLGHSSIVVTLDRYSHLNTENRRHVATVLDDLIEQENGHRNGQIPDMTARHQQGVG